MVCSWLTKDLTVFKQPGIIIKQGVGSVDPKGEGHTSGGAVQSLSRLPAAVTSNPSDICKKLVWDAPK